MSLALNPPHLTVACIIEESGKFLFVREKIGGCIVYNQPAGHLESNETLIEAAKRETLEETGWVVDISHFLGIYQYTSQDEICYVRHCFVAKPKILKKDFKLDEPIIDICWLSPNEAKALSHEMRSPLVLTTLKDYLIGNFYPLKLLNSEIQTRPRTLNA